MKTLLHRTCLGLFAIVWLTQCAATPQSRIQHHPQLYARLGAQDQHLVSRGIIREGMTRDAVFLAWGAPDSVARGSNRGRATENWTYLGQRPVNTMNMSFGYGGWGYGGWGPYGWGGGPYWGGGPFWGGGPSVTYVPYTAGIVEFSSGRVVRWAATNP